MHYRLLPLAVIACLLAPTLTASAGASSDSLYDEYLQSGTIAGCNHSEAELQSALTTVPADIQAYDPGFPEALNAALDRRAGGCAGAPGPNSDPTAKGGTVISTDGSPGPAGVAVIPPRPLPQPSASTGFPVVIICIAAVLFAALAALVAIWPARRSASEPS